MKTKTEDQIDKLVTFLDSEREKHEGVGLADFHIECITVAYNQGRVDKEKELADREKQLDWNMVMLEGAEELMNNWKMDHADWEK